MDEISWTSFSYRGEPFSHVRPLAQTGIHSCSPVSQLSVRASGFSFYLEGGWPSEVLVILCFVYSMSVCVCVLVYSVTFIALQGSVSKKFWLCGVSVLLRALA